MASAANVRSCKTKIKTNSKHTAVPPTTSTNIMDDVADITSVYTKKLEDFENKLNFSYVIAIDEQIINPYFYLNPKNLLLQTLSYPLATQNNVSMTWNLKNNITLSGNYSITPTNQYSNIGIKMKLRMDSYLPNQVISDTSWYGALHEDEGKQYLEIVLQIYSNETLIKIYKHVIPKKPLYVSDSIIYNFFDSVDEIVQNDIEFYVNLGEFNFNQNLVVCLKCPLKCTIRGGEGSCLVLRAV